jgi:hypothetical protein
LQAPRRPEGAHRRGQTELTHEPRRGRPHRPFGRASHEKQARRLKPGDRVQQWGDEKGTVTRTHRAGDEPGISCDGVTIRWDCGVVAIRYFTELDAVRKIEAGVAIDTSRHLERLMFTFRYRRPDDGIVAGPTAPPLD